MFIRIKHISAVLIGLLTLGLFLASPAGAEAAPDFTPIAPSQNDDQPPLAPGGNGPDDPDGPFILGPIEVLPLFPSASVAVSCTNETATVTVENPSLNSFIVDVKVDGSLFKAGVVQSKQQFIATFPLAENASKSVKVLRGSTTMLDKKVTRDCLLPAPSYQVIPNCDTKQAHVRLINNGDDVAKMAVQHGDAFAALASIAAHSSKDWLLNVSPGETVSFKVLHGSTAIGHETLTFGCASPEPVVEEPEVEQPEVEEPEVEQPEVEQPGKEAIETGHTSGTTNQSTDSEVDAEFISTDVLGEAEEFDVADISEIETNGGELVSEVAGPTMQPATVGTDGGMGILKMGLIAIWVLVLAAAGFVFAIANRRRANAS